MKDKRAGGGFMTVKEIPMPWNTVLLLCGKCARKMKGGYGHKGKETLRTALRADLKAKGFRRGVRLIETRCMGICPKKAVTALNASKPDRILTIPNGTGAADEVVTELLEAEGEQPPPAAPMKVATFNINNVNRRLPNLVAWLEAAKPDVVCLQELKTEDKAFPEATLREAGYSGIWQGQRTWNGVAILASGTDPVLTRRGLPGDSDDKQARYIEAAVNGVLIACIYLPNGNPQPGPKFDYKLAWFERLIAHAATLFETDAPVILAGDYNVVPTDFDIYPTNSWDKDALVQPAPRACYGRLLEQGWTDAIRTLHPDEPMYTFWHYLRNRWPRDAGLRLDHLLVNRPAAARLGAAGVDREVRGEAGASDHAPAWVQLKATRARRQSRVTY